MGILGSILSVALPVAKVAAKVLPAVLESVASDADANTQTVQTGLVDWVPDKNTGKVYCVNATNNALACSFQREVELDGSYGVESEGFLIPPRNAVDATKDIERNIENGSFGATYEEASPPAADAAGPFSRQIFKYLPLLAATTFAAFGGSITFSRGKTETGDFWKIQSDTRLRSIAFDYRGQSGSKTSFKVDLKDPSAADAETFDYQIDLDADATSTGLLSDFSVTLQSEEADFVAKLSNRETIPFEDLPDNVQAQLTVRAS